MLVKIKKLLKILGAMCVTAIVIAELSQHSPRTMSTGWTSNSERLTDASINNMTTTFRNKARHAQGVIVYEDADQQMSEEEEEKENAYYLGSINTQKRQSTDIYELQELREQKTRKTALRDHHEEMNDVDIQSSSTTDVTTDDEDDLDEDEKKRLRLSPYIYHEDQEMKRLSRPPIEKTFKLIHCFLNWYLKRYTSNRFHTCHYNMCRFTNSMFQADAVVFKPEQIRDNVIPDFHRPKDQRWIFLTNDPPIKDYRIHRPDVVSKFNWTITYQLHADYPKIFGMLRRTDPPAQNFEALYAKKDRQIAWFVSHCHTSAKRELYVERMEKIVHVDVFGRCGKLTCGISLQRLNDKTECLPMLTNHYKFYLAFENSFCKDYVTEKFFKLFLNVDVIPVVRGGFDYKRYLPSGIFIDASDYKTPEELAHYLVKLGNDKKKYIAMLKKKSQWTMASTSHALCLLCQALHTAESTPKYYSNLTAKFYGEPPACSSPTDLGKP